MMKIQKHILQICQSNGMAEWFNGTPHSILFIWLIYNHICNYKFIPEWDDLLYMNTNHSILFKLLIISIYDGMTIFKN